MRLELNKELNAAYQLSLMGRNVLLLGQAGSGKSTLIRALIDHYKKAKDKKYAILAPTHKAALAVKGSTLASSVHIDYKDRRNIPDKILTVDNQLSNIIRFVHKKDNLDVLIIDEFGMVRADELQSLDCALRNKYIKDKPFGGVQIIAVGDYKQIPPVLTDRYSEEYFKSYETIYNFSSPAFHAANFFPVNATENLRMKHHPDQIKLMEMIRKQENLDYVAQEINKLVTIDPFPRSDDLYVTKYNVVVDKINERKLRELQGDEYVIQRMDYIFDRQYALKTLKHLVRESRFALKDLYFSSPTFSEETVTVGTKKDISNKKSIEPIAQSPSVLKEHELVGFTIKNPTYNSLPTQDITLKRRLHIKVGAKVLTYYSGLDKNKRRYFNGQIFKLLGSYQNRYLKLQDVDTGKVYYIERVAVPITVHKKVNGSVVYETIGYQTQFPVMLAYAQTYHKTQGMTLKSYVLDTRGNDFVTGLTYVGLSRAVDLTKVIVTAPITTNNLLIDPKVKEFYDKYRCY